MKNGNEDGIKLKVRRKRMTKVKPKKDDIEMRKDKMNRTGEFNRLKKDEFFLFGKI